MVRHPGERFAPSGGTAGVLDEGVTGPARPVREPLSGTIPTSLMRVNGSNENGWLMYSFHSGGANAAMVDGVVQFVGEDVSLLVLGQLATRAGCEPALLP